MERRASLVPMTSENFNNIFWFQWQFLMRLRVGCLSTTPNMVSFCSLLLANVRGGVRSEACLKSLTFRPKGASPSWSVQFFDPTFGSKLATFINFFLLRLCTNFIYLDWKFLLDCICIFVCYHLGRILCQINFSHFWSMTPKNKLLLVNSLTRKGWYQSAWLLQL